MIRSPALRQDSTLGQNCSKAAIKVEVLQLPSRTQRTLVAVGEMEKIFILADYDAPLLFSIPADFRVGRFR